MSGVFALGGKDGKAVVNGTLITRLTSWRLSETCSTSAWGDSESAGYTNRIAARKDATGTIGGKFDLNRQPHTVFRPGDLITLALWYSTPSTSYWYFPSAVITRFELEVNPDTKEVVGWTADFEADGIYYHPSQSGKPTVTLPAS